MKLWVDWAAGYVWYTLWKRSCTCELQMNLCCLLSESLLSCHNGWVLHLSFCPIFFVSSLKPALLFYLFIFLHQCRIPAICFMFGVSCHSNRESGQTSGIPWQGSPNPHPTAPLGLLSLSLFFFIGADWLEIFRLVFVPPEKTKSIQNQNTVGRSVFHLEAEQRLQMLLLVFFSFLFLKQQISD